MIANVVLSPDHEALSRRVEKAELELRLLDALIRIRAGERELAALRIRNEESVGIYRVRESAIAGDAP